MDASFSFQPECEPLADDIDDNVRAWRATPATNSEQTVSPDFEFKSHGEGLAPPIAPSEFASERGFQPKDRSSTSSDSELFKGETANSQPRVTAVVVGVEERARRLAACLNHPEVTLEHYVIAMTFEKGACEAFECKKLELRNACLANLIGRQSISKEREASQLNFSEKVQQLRSAAAEFAQKREGELQLVSVHDLSEALPRDIFELPSLHITVQTLALRMDQIISSVEGTQSQIAEYASLMRADFEQQTAKLIEKTAQSVQVQLDSQVAKLEALVRQFAPVNGAVSDNVLGRPWTLWRRLTAVIGIAVISASAVFTFIFR
jgi:hypothetical protein